MADRSAAWWRRFLKRPNNALKIASSDLAFQRAGKKLQGKTRRPRRLSTNGFITHILPAGPMSCGVATSSTWRKQENGHAGFARRTWIGALRYAVLASARRRANVN